MIHKEFFLNIPIVWKEKTIEQLKALNTKRLLLYYRAEQKRYIRNKELFYTDYEYCWYVWTDFEPHLEKLKKWQNYLDTIKVVLNTREHIK